MVPRPAGGTSCPRDQIDAVTPPLGGSQRAVAWEVIGQVTVEGKGWRAPVARLRGT